LLDGPHIDWRGAPRATALTSGNDHANRDRTAALSDVRFQSGPNAAVLTVTEGGGVDYTGDGTADPDFPLLAGEKEALAANYPAGTEVIRSITTHFSAFDTNPCWACNGSCEENGTSSAGDEPQCDTCPGSVLRMQNQTLSEFFPVSGTGLALGWHSNRFNVRSAGVNLALGLLADGGQPEGVRGTFFRLDVAGRTIVVENFDGGIGDAQRLAWDGKDVFGRTVQGSVPARASTGYGFGAVSVAAVAGGGGGGATGIISYSTPSFGVWPPPGARAMASTREAVYFLRHFSHSLGDWVPRENLGNLTLSVVHGYSEDGTLHLGTGGIVTAGEGGALLRYVAGGGTDTSEDAGSSTVSLSAAPVFADAPEGLYFIERESRVRLLKADGGVVTVAGSASMGFAGDGAPATQGRFNYARLLAVDPQSNVFVGDIENLRIRRIDAATGLLSTYVGSGLRGSSPDGTLANEARLDGLADLLFGHDGHLYFMATDGQSGNLLRRVENGRVYTVAGGNCTASRPPWEARNPREVCFRGAPHWLGQDRDGRLYVAGLGSGDGTSDLVVRRIEADGSVRRLAGAGPSRNAEEPVARNACFSGLTGMTVGDDGTVYVGESGGTGCGLRGPGLRAISPEGDLSLFVGGVRAAVTGAKPPDGSAYATQLNGIGDVTRRPNGTLLFLHRGPTPTLHEVVLPGPRVRRLVPSRDGNEVYGFDARGRHLRTTSARTGVTLWEFTWGPNGLDSVKDVNGDVTTVERDASGRALSLIATDGQRIELTFDATGRVSMLKDSEGRFVEAAYKEGTSLLSEWKDQNGNPTRFEWDGAGNLVAHINALGARKQWERRGNDVVFTSPLGKVTTYGRQVFSDGALLTTSFPDGTKTVRGYSGAFRRMQSPDGTTTSVLMQSGTRFGRAVDVPGEVTVRTPSGLESRLVATRTTTTAPNDPLSIREEVEELRINGRLWRSRFDGTARTYELVSPLGRRVSMTLDEKSRPRTVTAPGVLPVTYAYDPRGRVTSVTQGSRNLSYTYGPEGYLASVKNALNHETRFESDSTGRVSKVIQADAKDVTMQHDAVGNLTSVTPADRTAHTLGYSKVNEVTSYEPPQLPGLVPETSTFDLDGLVSESGHADGSETLITRDAAGRTTQIKTPWWTNDIVRDAMSGQVSTITRGSARLEYHYDGFLLTEEKATGVAAATSQWTFDADFRVASHTINGATINSTYDPDGRLSQRGPVTLSYDPAMDRLSSMTVGVVTTTYNWNEFGELSRISASANGLAIYSEVIQYDDAGRITAVDEVVQGVAVGWAYGYDAMGRLTRAARNGSAPSTWTYDGNGNRVTEGNARATYDAQDRLISRGSVDYTWDALGGRASKTESGATTRYAHDGFGALQSVTLPDGSVISYEYDGRQRRVASRRNGVVTSRWVYDGQYRVAAELNTGGAVETRFIYASQLHSPDCLIRGSTTYGYVKNHLGSVRLVVNAASGAVAQALDHDPWGTPSDTANGFQPFSFAGGLQDLNTGLEHFGYRDLDSSTANWTAKDPIALAGGLSATAYAGANPVSFLDPDGLRRLTLSEQYQVTDAIAKIQDVPEYSWLAPELSQMLLEGRIEAADGITGFVSSLDEDKAAYTLVDGKTYILNFSCNTGLDATLVHEWSHQRDLCEGRFNSDTDDENDPSSRAFATENSYVLARNRENSRRARKSLPPIGKGGKSWW
jgi:RHS repeat-associated protein